MISAPSSKYKVHLPRPSCPYSACKVLLQGKEIDFVVRYGRFKRRWDKSRIQRYLCRGCRKTFSDSTFSDVYRQHKPFLNPKLFAWFSSAGSQKRAAIYFKCNFKTVSRKFVLLGIEAMKQNELARTERAKSNKFKDIQFDEMESSEHTKLKPLSIPLAVDAVTREILGFEVCKMPAKGHLVEKALKKYGPRVDQRDEAMEKLFQKISPIIDEDAHIISDSKPQYPKHVKKHFPKSNYSQVMSRAGSVAGQGELKKIGKDPLFALNHTAAMIRAHINRMFRKTWNTTKKPLSLYYHLEIYAYYHNNVLIKDEYFQGIQGMAA